jgi:nucleoside-diphosphate-sugar epimerase
MKKCAVIGSSGFIGYELVCQLMEYNHVTAVVTNKGNESDLISEEKVFSIGRNANVVFVDEKEFILTVNEVFDTIFISHYFDDLKLNGDRSNIAHFESLFNNICSRSKNIIILLSSNKELSLIENKVNELNQKINHNSITFIELPSIYGPWEPSTGLVHELIVSDLGKKKLSIKNRYGSNEILYIEDVANAIRLISEKDLKEHKYTITAKESMYLPAQYQFTAIQQLFEEKKLIQLRLSADTTPYIILNSTSFEKGVQKQKQQIQQYFHLY